MDAEDNKVDDTEVVESSELNTELEEGTASAETLKPNGGSGGTESKAKMLDTMVSLLSQLGKEDLSKFHNDALAQIGHEADKIPGGAAAKNKNSINAKPSAAKGSVKEDLDEIFENEEAFSEDFKDKASTIFEAAVNTRINLETVRLEEEFAEREEKLQEEFEEKLQERANEIFEELTEKLDQYLNYNVDTYMEENKVEIESTLKTDIAENFILGLHNLFSEHYITVPEEKVDLLGEMKAEIESLKQKLNENINEKLELEEAVENFTRNSVVSEASEGLTDSQAEKFANLVEGIEYTDAESYAKKVAIIKESYFGKKAQKSDSGTGIITEEIDGDVEDLNEDVSSKTVSSNPNMDRYLKAISRK